MFFLVLGLLLVEASFQQTRTTNVRNAGLLGYFKIVRPRAGVDDNLHHLHIREVELHDCNGNSVALSCDERCESSASDASAEGQYAIDGLTTTVTHSSYGDKTYQPWPGAPVGSVAMASDHWLSFVLDEPLILLDVCELEIWNRNDHETIQQRFVGAYVEFYSADDELLSTHTFTNSQQIYQVALDYLQDAVPLDSELDDIMSALDTSLAESSDLFLTVAKDTGEVAAVVADSIVFAATAVLKFIDGRLENGKNIKDISYSCNTLPLRDDKTYYVWELSLDGFCCSS
eukprot:Lithocolla_globosa_v1_NODE_33_length_8825_cov_67.659863.p3 type:complete len:287 gc:universal NODE_33_length_8825_cov_67.659863:6572-5712(-)